MTEFAAAFILDTLRKAREQTSSTTESRHDAFEKDSRSPNPFNTTLGMASGGLMKPGLGVTSCKA